MQKRVDETILLGIDPGTRITGYGLIRLIPQGMRVVDFGCIRPPSSAPLPQRYLTLFNGIDSLIQKHQPTAIAIETQFVNKNPQSTIKLAMARGVVLILSAKYEIPLFEYTPSKAKKAVCGHGSAGKERIQKMIQLLLHLPFPPEPEDAADALALAVCHANAIKLKVAPHVCLY